MTSTTGSSSDLVDFEGAYLGATLKHKNVLRRTINEDVGEEEPLLASDQPGKSPGTEREEGVTKSGAINIATSMIVVSLAMASYSIFSDAMSQWIYVEFENQVLGANASLINSTASNPCVKDNQTDLWAKELDKAQSLASRFSIYAMIVTLLPAFFTNLLLGIYADQIGRRILFLAPLIGLFIRAFVGFVVAFWKLSIYWNFVGMACIGLTGHLPAIFMGIYVYTADNTGHKKSRSFGMVIAQTAINVCFSLSHLAVGYFIDAKGYAWPMFTASVILAFCLVICYFFLKETLETAKKARKKTFTEGFNEVFSFYITKGKNSNYRRLDFSLLGLVFFLFSTCLGVSIQSMFLMNEPLCWSSIKIGQVTTYQGLLGAFTSLVLMKALQRCLSDDVICIVSLVSAAASRFVLAFAQYDWMIYVAYTVGMFELLLLPIIRAILSRMVPVNNRGSLFASVAVIEVATFVVAGAGFDALYSFTVSFWHGLTYLVIACCVSLATGLMILFTVTVRKRHLTRVVDVQEVSE
ncbi:proton-coupled folate transporter isoform X2 [Biomphalaria glabrata]|nr:proton-coupled folate transporter isoform X2 [Biomphalaria glabrata]